ncbi:hypothetical protein PTMSG1_01612 [Pyrenophora teres f. maculata]|nr:hypothetical protein PTMSG1_01612 [Pyrenophora teres f. maculata]
MDNRAIRLPPTARRNLFATAQQQQQQQTSRRQNGTTPSIRPDSREVEPDIFQQPTEDELVERDDQGEYVIHAPVPVYRNNNADAEREGDDEAEQENELIEMYVNGKPDAHWDADAVEEEVRAALKNSLRKKVASLEDDKWMFEGETEVKK